MNAFPQLWLQSLSLPPYTQFSVINWPKKENKIIKLKINLIDATFLKICIDIVIILLALLILTMIMRTENLIL